MINDALFTTKQTYLPLEPQNARAPQVNQEMGLISS